VNNYLLNSSYNKVSQQNSVILKKIEAVLVVFLLVLVEIKNVPQFVLSIIGLLYYVIPLIVMINRWKRFTYILTQDIYLTLLILLAIASFLWSENPSKTLESVKYLLRCSVFGIYLGMTFTPKELLRIVSSAMFILMIISLFIGLLLPGYNAKIINSSLAWSGVFGHKQDFGPYMGFAGLTFLINYFDRRSNRWFALFGLALAIILIFLSKSATALIIFCVALNIMIMYKVIKQVKHRGILLLTLLAIYVSVLVVVAVNIEIIVGLLDKNLELNGRTPIWTLAIESALKRPWLGHGYQGFWTSEASNYVIANTWAIASEGFRTGDTTFHSHNGYIDLFLDLGAIGLSLFMINLFSLLKRIIYLSFLNRRIENFWCFQFLVFFLVNLYANGRGILWYKTDWILYLAICFSSALEYNRMRRDKHKSQLYVSAN
jgi:exopolysaccharide production protein ExoQ